MPPERDMQGDTRTRLLEAAERVLIEEGVMALTMRRVGDVSGLNPTLITYHFGTVAMLLANLRDHNMGPMLEDWACLEDPIPAGGDPLDILLERWLRPLLAPACFTPSGRALVVLDEIAAHGEGETAARLVETMSEVADRFASLLTPHLPGLDRQELRWRLRFIAGAALGPPPRARLGPDERDPAMSEEALAALTRFCRAALTGAHHTATAR
ncbi:TetR/AcrR family transcriptional regulator [Altererythrobacter fulvus]|uniref:TetR/AcrR family transcriptional regulator n=1 Tax=Caenibius fulvus TaxID=2126012 RepID=UPI0030195325